MKIVIGNDHAGVDLKNKIKEELRKNFYLKNEEIKDKNIEKRL